MLLLNTDNFVPVSRTPWGGNLIPKLKSQGLGLSLNKLPQRVGESWEVSTEPSFVSKVTNQAGALLTEYLSLHAQAVLGEKISSLYGAHCPLLLKWLHANDTLSVQLHPNNQNPKLKSDECGKPESWFVLDVEPGAFVYLGFQDGVTNETVRNALQNGRPEAVLQKYFPKKYDYISVPTGLVHATGPGVLIAEPQYVLPAKKGKTWRLSDWGRLYDQQGNLSAEGTPRELHLEEAFHAIDWSFPTGVKGIAEFVTHFAEDQVFSGSQQNPFAMQLFTHQGKHTYKPLVPGAFSLATCFGGEIVAASREHGSQLLRCGQSAIICASEGDVELELKQATYITGSSRSPGLAIFALQVEMVK